MGLLAYLERRIIIGWWVTDNPGRRVHCRPHGRYGVDGLRGWLGHSRWNNWTAWNCCALIGPARIMNKRSNFIFSLSLLYFLSLFILGGGEEHLASLDTWVVLIFALSVILGTEWECVDTVLREGEALGIGRLELYQEVLGIGSRGFR